MAAASISFIAQTSHAERWGKQVQVRLQSQEQAAFCCGLASFRVSSRAGTAEYVMTPTAAVWRRGPTLAVTGASPPEKLFLTMESEAVAAATQEHLQSMATAVTHSLHLRAEPGAAPLALRPIKRPQAPAGRGPFSMAGYVISSTDRCHFSLRWAELYGPNEHGSVGFYFFASHDPNAQYADFTAILGPECVEVQDSRMRVACPSGPRGGARHSHELAGDEYIVFRSPEEAKLWADMIAAVLDPSGRGQRDVARKADAVASGFRQAAAQVKEPLLVQDTRQKPSRPTGAPADDVAMHARERQAHKLHELARAALEDFPSQVGSPTGTTNFNLGTTNFGTTNFNTTSYSTTSFN